MNAMRITNPNFAPPLMNGRLTASKEMRTNAVDVTPEQAARWLRENLNNRPLSAAVVARYAADMLAGNWTLTHQGIAFSPSGTLLDGQHRLSAIVKANVAVRMLVSFNVPPAALLAVDQNHRRRVDEQINLAGGMGEVDRIDVAVLRAMLNGLAGVGARKTFAEERDLLGRHLVAIRFAREASAGRAVKVCSSMLAVYARAYYSIDHAAVRRFAQAFTSGIAPADGGEPIGLLIRWYMANAATVEKGARVEIYGRTSRALSAYVRGESIAKLYMPSGELFELPA